MADEKMCTKCNETKPFKRFSMDRSAKDGMCYMCKDCTMHYKKGHYRKNKKMLKEISRLYRENNKEKVAAGKRRYWRENVELLSEKCKIKMIEKNKVTREKYGVNYGTMVRYGKTTVVAVMKKCECMCTTCDSRRNLHIHHRDGKGITYEMMGGEMNNDINNLELQCRECHGRMHNEKLTSTQVREIRRRMAQGEKQKDVVSDYDIGRQTVWRILKGLTYKNI